jgi:zinc protease
VTPGRPDRTQLDNGLTVILEEHAAADVVAVQLWVRAGARDETEEEAGLSHFIEHLLFKGTLRRGPGEIDRTISGLGGEMNAATSQDFTYFHVVLPARHAATALDVIADAAQHAALDPAELDRERQVVLEEIRRAEDSPTTCLWRVLSAAHFAGHAYARPVLGRAEVIADTPREGIVDYYRRHYQPATSTLVVVGPVEREQVLGLARTLLGSWDGGAAPASAPRPAPALDGVRRAARRKPLRQTHVGLAWRGPLVPEADVYAADLLASVLGGGRSSRLYQELRERLGLVSSVAAAFYTQRDASTLAVTARTDARTADRIERSVLDEAGRLGRELVDEAELGRALSAVEAGYAFGRETAEGVAYAYGAAETVWTLDFELGYLEEVRKVTRERVREAARRYLGADRFSVAVLGPGDPVPEAFP